MMSSSSHGRLVLELVVTGHVIRHEPEARPGADGVGAEEPALEIARGRDLDAAGIVLQRRDQAGAPGLVAGPDSQIGIDLGKRVLRRLVVGENVDAEVLVSARRLVRRSRSPWGRCWRWRGGP